MTLSAGALLLLGLVIVIVLVGRMTSVFGSIKADPVDFPTLKLSDKPNQFLVCPRDFCSSPPHRESAVYRLSADALRQGWRDMIGNEPRLERIGSMDALRQEDYVQRSKWMRFPDLITVRFLPLEDGRSTLAIYSRSLVGHYDFGVNRARIESWLQKLETAAENSSAS
jgi:uncharacterized protein (DUF1499 family)